MKKIGMILLFCGAACTLRAAETGTLDVAGKALFDVNNLWVVLGGMLVFVMHLGFACVETGLTRAKNCTNILFKNTLTPAIGFLTFAVCGFGLMFPNEGHWLYGKVLGFAGWGLDPLHGGATESYTYWSWFFFQGMFAATAATIVSGAVAERIKVNSYLLFTTFYVMFVYPLLGSWGWGGGWLADLNFHDFAGSTFVHSIGGWGALAGVILLGPRIGKYVNGKAVPIMGHNMPLATIGVFLLWFGWFGFNGASTATADGVALSWVLVTTMLAACASIVSALMTSAVILKKPDLSMTLNGCLAGLVGITAAADCVTPFSAILIGAIAGILVVLAVLCFDKIQLDDPVGALSVHLVCGIWGTLAVGLFSAEYSVLTQAAVVLAVGAVAFTAALGIFAAIKYTVGLRVSSDEELKGLDLGEHGMEAYAGFQFFSNI